MSKALDTSDFDSKMAKLERLEPGISGRILVKVMQQVKIDADEIEPKTPHLEGNLRGNVIISIIDENQEIVQIHFTEPYGARLHEAVNDIDPVTGKKIKWSEAGVGPKYMETKLIRFGKKYGELLAEYHREELERVN